MNEIVFEKCELDKINFNLSSTYKVDISEVHNALVSQGDALIVSAYKKLSSIKEVIDAKEELLFLNSLFLDSLGLAELSSKLKTDQNLIIVNGSYILCLKYPIICDFEELKKTTLDDKFRIQNQKIITTNYRVRTDEPINGFVVNLLQGLSRPFIDCFVLKFDPVEAEKLILAQEQKNAERMERYEEARAQYEESQKVITNQKFILLVTAMFAKEYVKELGASEVGRIFLAPKNSKNISKILEKAKVFFDLMSKSSRNASVNNYLKTISIPHLISFIKEKQASDSELKKNKILALILAEAKKQQQAGH